MNIFESATIKWDGSIRGPEERPIELFLVETAKGRFWFEVSYDFVENGNDFRVTVRNFGLPDRTAAGSTTPLIRRHFSRAEAQVAQTRLEALFLGPHDSPCLPFVPFRRGRSKCLGVNFPNGWIAVK
jgi:hypothetical protein